jgi:hypothetical protein
VVEACRWLADADTTPVANARRTIRRHGAGARHRSSEIIGPALATSPRCLAGRAFHNAPIAITRYPNGVRPWPLSKCRRRLMSFERRALSASCDRNGTIDHFVRDSRPAAPQLSQSFFTRSGVDTGPAPMPKSLRNQIPDTAPCIEWLAIVCSIVGGRFCAVLFSNVVLNLRVLPEGGVKGSASARARPREDRVAFSQ